MQNKSFFDTLFDAYGTALFIVVGIPLLLIIILCVGCYQFFYGMNVRSQYKDTTNIIFTSKFEKAITETVENIYDKDIFLKFDRDDSELSRHMYSVEVNYYFRDSDKSAEEYDSLVKNEITNLYNSLKNKKLVSDNSFEDDIKKRIGMTFYYPKSDEKYEFLCGANIDYTDEKGFDEEVYQKSMNTTLITQEKLNSILNR